MAGQGLGEQLQDIMRSPDNACFGCGPQNPAGLRLQFEREGEIVRARFTPGEWHGGWAGIVHGGILATALDEAMAYVLFFSGEKAVTARMEVRYRLPVYQGDELTVEAWPVRHARRLVDIEGRLVRGVEVVAEASGRFMRVGPLEPEALTSR